MLHKSNRLSTLVQKIKMCVFVSFIVLTPSLAAQAEWTVLVYVQANNNLSDYAEKNFTDMASVGSSDKLNILIEWHQPKKKGAWRYKIDKGKMVFDACVAPESDGNNPQDLVNSMQWAVSKYPAQKYSLVLWDHGIGVLDPIWGKYKPWSPSDIINPKKAKNNPRIQIPGITIDSRSKQKKHHSKAITTTKSRLEENDDTRGILFNDQTKTYMTNQQLSQALSSIKKNVLHGKKIDLLGMDACLMAMVEVGYQAKNYADILVASEEVELAHGWSYSSFLQPLKNNSLSAVQFAQNIVLTYEKYYKNRVQFFTQSAINLNKIQLVKEGIDGVIHHAKRCKDGYLPIVQAIKKARSSCQQFSAHNYIDLHSFLNELYTHASAIKSTHTALSDLKMSIKATLALVEDSVIAYTAGQYLKRAHGLSIYYPTGPIDPSYAKTDFAQESHWLCLLTNLE